MTKEQLIFHLKDNLRTLMNCVCKDQCKHKDFECPAQTAAFRNINIEPEDKAVFKEMDENLKKKIAEEKYAIEGFRRRLANNFPELKENEIIFLDPPVAYEIVGDRGDTIKLLAAVDTILSNYFDKIWDFYQREKKIKNHLASYFLRKKEMPLADNVIQALNDQREEVLKVEKIKEEREEVFQKKIDWQAAEIERLKLFIADQALKMHRVESEITFEREENYRLGNKIKEIEKK